MPGTTFNAATTSLAAMCITWGESEVNKYLSKRYDLSASTFQTSTSVPPIVRACTEWLAIGYLQKRMARGGKEAMAIGQDSVDMAIDNLKMIRDYELDLVNTAGSIIVDMSGTGMRVLSNTDDYAPTFDEDDPTSWKISQDKLDDISDGRS